MTDSKWVTVYSLLLLNVSGVEHSLSQSGNL